MPRYALTLAYDGTDFAGMWFTPGERTVSGELREALSRAGIDADEPAPASRTDAGVHARAQRVHVDCAAAYGVEDLRQRLEHQLPADCSCIDVEAVADDWHAAHSSTGKTYHYQLDCSEPRNPLLARFSYRPTQSPDHDGLARAAELIIGTHDFSAFTRRGDHRDDHQCTFSACHWFRSDDMLTAELSADRFTYRLCRSLVGAMLACALKRCSLDELAAALTGERTRACDHQLPARGLHLVQVHY